MGYLAYSIAWISTAAAVIAGLCFTNSAWCLLALILPATIKLETDEERENDEYDF